MSVTNTLYENLAAIKHGVSDNFRILKGESAGTANQAKGDIKSAIGDIVVLAKYAGIIFPKSLIDSMLVACDGEDIDASEEDVIKKIESLQEIAIQKEDDVPFVLAIFRTPNFEFTVLSKSEDVAAIALRNKWLLHASNTGADFDYFDDNLDSLAFQKIIQDQVIYT
jgi:hypothetical protein